MNRKTLIIFIFVIMISVLFLFHKKIFFIKKIDIQGSHWIKKSIIKKMVNQKESLIFLDKEKLTQKIMKLGYIKEVNITIDLLNKLIIKVKEKSVVAEVVFKNKRYYLTSKGEILRGKSYVLRKKIPRIMLKKKIDVKQLSAISNNLEFLKFHDLNFFKKISEIAFDEINNSDIFIVCRSNKYILKSNFNLDDLLKIKFLEKKKLKYKIFDMRGNYIVVNS